MQIESSLSAASVLHAAEAGSNVALRNQAEQASQDFEAIRQDLKSGQPATEGTRAAPEKISPQLEKVANDFESIFLSMMLKQMRSSLNEQGEGLFSGDKSDTLGGMFDMFMSQHMAEAKPLGIAKTMQAYMQHASPQAALAAMDSASELKQVARPDTVVETP